MCIFDPIRPPTVHLHSSSSVHGKWDFTAGTCLLAGCLAALSAMSMSGTEAGHPVGLENYFTGIRAGGTGEGR